MVQVDVAAAEDDTDVLDTVAGTELVREERHSDAHGCAGLDDQLHPLKHEFHRRDDLCLADRVHAVDVVADCRSKINYFFFFYGRKRKQTH